MSVRFAPSPTGAFHLGNLRTAWISHFFARALRRPWVVRFEDIDRPRVQSGALEKQLSDLRSLGLDPDEIQIQSKNHPRHFELFERARQSGSIYPCFCSRKELLDDLGSMASAPHRIPAIYNGRCRGRDRPAQSRHPTLAWRFKDPDDVSGRSDFIIGRTLADGTDFMPAYHWACAIDDFDGGHELLVRASDLASAAQIQRRIHHWVGITESRPRPFPAIFHTALIMQDDGNRLEKRTRGVTLDELLQRGYPPERIAELLAKSFDAAQVHRYAPERIWGEDRESLTLAQLIPE